MNITHITRIDRTTGNIMDFYDVPAFDYPAENQIIDNGIIKYIYEDFDYKGEPDRGSFVIRWYWDFDQENWAYRGDPPNSASAWVKVNNICRWAWDSDALLKRIKVVRNNLLMSCDWAVLPDSALSESQVNEIKVYRQALRDIPQTIDMNLIQSASTVPWPTPPSWHVIKPRVLDL